MTSTLNNSYTASVIGLVMVMFSTSSTASPATDFFGLSTIGPLRESAKREAQYEHERELEQLRYENERKLIELKKHRKSKPSGTRRAANTVENCHRLAGFAGDIMAGRQKRPMSEMIQTVNDFNISEGEKEAFRKLIIKAYKKPRFRTIERQVEAEEDFENTIFLDCYADGS